MSSSDSNSVVGGIGFVDLLQIVFIVLKLCKVIDWKWYLVLLPLEIQLGVVLIALAVFLIMCIAPHFSKRKRK